MHFFRSQRSLAILSLLVTTLFAATTPHPASADDAALYAALRSPGHIGLMRHARAPGTDDPPNFRIGDCSTQRNLSQQGRAQAAAVGERLRAAGIAAVELLSSQWCRCLDTARLMEMGDVEELPQLNSLVSYPGRAREMTRDLKAWILERDLDEPTLLVTHQVNIAALIGAYPQEGDIVVARRTEAGELEVVGTIAAP